MGGYNWGAYNWGATTGGKLISGGYSWGEAYKWGAITGGGGLEVGELMSVRLGYIGFNFFKRLAGRAGPNSPTWWM